MLLSWCYTSATIDTSLTDDIDNNGTINNRKMLMTSHGLIFAEGSIVQFPGISMTAGVDLIPFTADLTADQLRRVHLKQQQMAQLLLVQTKVL